MAGSKRKTIKSNPLDSIVARRSKSSASIAAEDSAPNQAAAEAVVHVAENLVSADESAKPVSKRVRSRRPAPEPSATMSTDAILNTAAETETPAPARPETPAESATPTHSTHCAKSASSATPAEPVLTAEALLEREFTPATAMVVMHPDRFDDEHVTELHALHTVKSWSQWAVVAGLIPAPIVDTMAISGVQIKMIHALCKLYNVAFKKEAAVAVVSGLVGGSLTTSLAGMGGVILSHLPGIGSVMKYTAQPALSYASTYAMGRVFMRHFENNGTMIDLDSKKLESYFKEQYAKGRKMFKYDFKVSRTQTV